MDRRAGPEPRGTGVRPATPDDAEAMARLVDIAGEGLPTFLWARAAGPGETPLDVGAARARREEGGFSYRNAHVVEEAGRVAGLLVGYRLPDPYETGDPAELPGPVRPLVELESLAPGSWYVNVVAVFEEFRGRGLGTRLLERAEALGRDSGADALSLIVAEQNAGAAALYARLGYRAEARLPIVPYPGIPHRGDWVLMVNRLDG